MAAPQGRRAQWRVIYDELRTKGQGEVISYDELSELIDRDVRVQRSPVERAMKELENQDHRTLVCVRGVGYRIAAATEHEQIAARHTVRSRRQLGKAADKVRSADRTQLTHEQAARLDALETSYHQHADMLERLAVRDRERAAELRTLRRETTGDIANLSDQIQRLTHTLQRHGINVDDNPAPAPITDPPQTPAAQ